MLKLVDIYKLCVSACSNANGVRSQTDSFIDLHRFGAMSDLNLFEGWCGG